MYPRIAKIIITQPNSYLRLGNQYNVAPTPFYHKATNANGRFGVWVFGDKHEVVFMPFAHFQVVEYRFNPSSITYGFIPSNKNPCGYATWNNWLSRVYFLNLRNEYWNLA